MSEFRGRELKIIIAVLLLSGSFLFFGNVKKVSATFLNSYGKAYNGTLAALEWNNLASDFLNKDGAATMTGPLVIGTAAINYSNLLIFSEADQTNESSAVLGLGSEIAGKQRMYFGVNNSDNYTYIGSVRAGDIYSNLILQPNSGNVGIGTTTPGGRLEINHNSAAHPQTSGTTDGAIALRIGASSVLNSVLDIGAAGSSPWGIWIQARDRTSFVTNEPLLLQPNGGNVGIGTSTPGKLLEVNGQAKFNNFAYGTSPVSTDLLAITTVEYVNGKTGGSGGVGIGTSGQTLRHNGTGWVANSTLFNDGTNIGIGTTDPGTYKLYVAGTGKYTGSVGADVQFLGQASDTITAPSFSWTTDLTTGIYRPTASQIALTLGGTQRALFTATNLTFTGQTSLTASSLVTLTTGASVDWGGATALTFTSDNATINGSDAANGSLTLQGTNSGTKDTSYVVLQPTGGNVGVGTTTPGKLLDVNGQAIFRNFAYGTTPPNTDLLAITTVEYVNGKTGGSSGVGTGTSGQTLRHNGTGWVANSTLFNDGTNIGIGTTSSNYKLDVQGGQMNASGGLCIADDCKTAWSQVTGTNYWGLSGNNLFASSTAYSVGVGTATPSAKIHSLSITEQLRLGYDASNYNSFTIGSSGSLVIAAVGTNPNITLTPGGIGYTILNGNVGIGTAAPGKLLEVNGQAKFNNFAYGTTPAGTDLLALTTVEYVNNSISTATSTMVFAAEYVGSTVSTYNGSQSGYIGANALCAATSGLSGSHVCTTGEIFNTINKGHTANIPANSTLWINNGPPGFTANSNDCLGWTSAVGTDFGAVWVKIASGDGFGSLQVCNGVRKYACCR